MGERRIDYDQRALDAQNAEEALARQPAPGSGTFRSVRDALRWYFESAPRFTGPVSPVRTLHDVRDASGRLLERVPLSVDCQGSYDFVGAITTRVSIQRVLERLPGLMEANDALRVGRRRALSPRDHVDALLAFYGGIPGQAPYHRQADKCGMGAPWTAADLSKRYGVSQSTMGAALGRVEGILAAELREGGVLT